MISFQKNSPFLGCRWHFAASFQKNSPFLGCRWHFATNFQKNSPFLGSCDSAAIDYLTTPLAGAAVMVKGVSKEGGLITLYSASTDKDGK